MLISCNSCNSKYLVNSAELKSTGRKVECAKCGNQWIQLPNTEEKVSSKVFLDQPGEKNKDNYNVPVSNLPSTYVQTPKVSTINSILVVLCIILLFVGFWIFRTFDTNSLIFLKFYVNEFYFNIKLIIKDITLIIHKIIN